MICVNIIKTGNSDAQLVLALVVTLAGVASARATVAVWVAALVPVSQL
jgi:hypothetical protein